MSIYDTPVHRNTAQDWVLQGKLVHGQGNFGSVAGLPPAAPRYTEARLTPIAADDASTTSIRKPSTSSTTTTASSASSFLSFPAGSRTCSSTARTASLSAWRRTSHRTTTREVFDGLIKLIDEPNASLQDIIELIPGPDFPTGGIVMGRRRGLSTGISAAKRSRITRSRARAEIVEEGKGKTPVIVIKEVPYQVSRNKLMEDIGALVKDERIKEITAVRDESMPGVARPDAGSTMIEMKRGADPRTWC